MYAPCNLSEVVAGLEDDGLRRPAHHSHLKPHRHQRALFIIVSMGENTDKLVCNREVHGTNIQLINKSESPRTLNSDALSAANPVMQMSAQYADVGYKVQLSEPGLIGSGSGGSMMAKGFSAIRDLSLSIYGR